MSTDEPKTTTWRFTVYVDVWDEYMADHDGSKEPPPNNPAEWYGGDLETALDKGLAVMVHDELHGEKVDE
jgi:hypothetical protein